VGLFPHAAGLELFTRPARARVVPADFFTDVAERLGLLVRLLRGGDRRLLAGADVAAGGGLGLGGGGLVERLGPGRAPGGGRGGGPRARRRRTRGSSGPGRAASGRRGRRGSRGRAAPCGRPGRSPCPRPRSTSPRTASSPRACTRPSGRPGRSRAVRSSCAG